MELDDDMDMDGYQSEGSGVNSDEEVGWLNLPSVLFAIQK